MADVRRAVPVVDGNLDGADDVRRRMETRRSAHWGRRPRTRRGVSLAAILLAMTIGACSASSTASPPSGSASPSGEPTRDGTVIDHAGGATDVVFRFEEGGGFVPMGFFATQAPQFTLYGNGTIIFRDSSLPPPPQPNPNIASLVPFQTVRFDEDQVQAFLRFALADSGLGVARASYSPGNVADAPTAVFTVKAGGLDKTVSVEALGFDSSQSPDAPILRAMAGLGDRVRAFASAVDGEATWPPTRWRGVLTSGPSSAPVAWPWTDLTPADFVQRAGPDAPQFPIRTLTSVQVAALGLSGIDGGFSGLSLTGPDGKAYTFALRPLLPDEGF
jgi:hypothetical protein